MTVVELEELRTHCEAKVVVGNERAVRVATLTLELIALHADLIATNQRLRAVIHANNGGK